MSETTVKKAFSTRELVLTALMAVLIAVCSWIQIPGEVPFTLQTFAVFLTVGILGGRNGLFAVLVYILLGAVGVPVFAGFTGGLGILLGSTGGYIVGFVFIALVYWAAGKIPVKGRVARIAANAAALIIGTAVCYAFGTAWFMYVYAKNVEAITLSTALKWCVTPFIVIDLIKMAAALALTDRLKKYVRV